MIDKLTVITGFSPEVLIKQHVFRPFDDRVLTFLGELSTRLVKDPSLLMFPNLVALGFWLRPASIKKMAQQFYQAPQGYKQFPAGTVFHLTPSNVDNLFVYSWVISLLCGNVNIVRLSSRTSNERELLLDVIAQLLAQPKYGEIALRTSFIAYDHDDQLTEKLFANIARRVLWGGDETIGHIRSLQVPPRCQDVIFPDRKSIALFSSAAILKANDLDDLMEKFYRDSYGFNQKACSSPRYVIWKRDADISAAKKRFWETFAQYVSTKEPDLSLAELMDKQVAMQAMALSGKVIVQDLPGRSLQVIELQGNTLGQEVEHPGGGLFVDINVDGLDQIDWNERDYQTITYWGVLQGELDMVLSNSGSPMADRVVPVGKALDFEPVWDGMNLFERLSCLVKLK